jgi:ABC-2 type transport system permease protein
MTGSFGGIVRFELAYYLRRISTWVYFGIFFLLAFLLIHLAGGAWDSVQLAVGGSGGNIHVNSPYATAQLSGVLSIFGILVTAALVGHAIVRDFETGTYPLFFTTPVSRGAYLGGRFTGAFLVNALVLSSIPLGLAFGSLMPYLDRERFGVFRAATYLQPFVVFILSNLFLTGAIFFALAALSRRMLPNYVGGIFLLLGYLMSSSYMEDLENEKLVGLLDAFGLGPYELMARYWTPAEKNTLLIPMDGLLLGNRALWMGLAALILILAFVRFRFSSEAREIRFGRRRASASAAVAGEEEPLPTGLALPVSHPSYGWATQWAQFRSIARGSFWSIVRNRYFLAIVSGGVLYMFLMSSLMNEMYGTTVWPVSYAVLEILGPNFWIFLLVIITLYAGDLVWAERDARINQVVDATPMRDWVPLAGKWVGLALMVVVLQAVVMLTGMLVQLFQGYTNLEPGLYLTSLFGLDLISLLLLSVLVMLIHVLANHKYVAHLIVILFLVFTGFMPEMGFEHNLYRYNSGGTGMYSDMNAFGPFLERFFWLKGYWIGWAILLAIASNLFWVRGQETGANWRIRLARQRFRAPAAAAATVAGMMILGLGGFIFYNTNVLNPYRTSYESEVLRAEYEQQYKRFEGIAQPRVTGVDLRVELYPARRHATVAGHFRLRNRTAEPIDSLHLVLAPEADVRAISFSRPAERVLNDERHGYHIFALDSPLQPGDSLRLDFEMAFGVEGFANQERQLELVENGTFFNSGILPSFGYDPNGELASDDTRRKHGLQPKERVAPLEDTAAVRNNYISRDADWIDFAITVGTSPDQIALAPGYLQREWTEGGRRYFRYEMDSPILNMYSVLSARYEVARDRWSPSADSGQAVVIEVYHHPGHEYNVARMIDAVKKSLDYYTREFGPYQHRQMRIVEFPRYQTFAQSFPNTVPYSEGIGFIARVKDAEEDVDYPFYVTAHEVAHQWWAHQVIGGNVQGSTVMSETLSQYSAMMVMEEEYGRGQIRKFLGYELDQYLQGRAFEQKKELPLLRVEGQGYIHYNKGAVVMYALRDLIGEDAVNGALRAYLEEVQYQEPPYTTVLDLYAHLKAATPDSLQTMLADLFEHITLYDNRVREATAAEAGEGRYRVTLAVEARKLRADSLGNESEVPMADYVDIGVFAADSTDRQRLGEELYLRKHRIESGQRSVTVEVAGEPARAGIDPYHKLIDRNRGDNTVPVRSAD